MCYRPLHFIISVHLFSINSQVLSDLGIRALLDALERFRVITTKANCYLDVKDKAAWGGHQLASSSLQGGGESSGEDGGVEDDSVGEEDEEDKVVEAEKGRDFQRGAETDSGRSGGISR